MFDQHFTMESQIRSIYRSAHFHIRNIKAIRHLLPPSAAAQLCTLRRLYSWITVILCCIRIPSYRIKPLYRVQNIAARVISLCSRDDDIDEVLKELHWLPINQCILFKVLLLVYKCTNGLASDYLSSLCVPYKMDFNSRKFFLDKPKIPSTRTKSYRDRAFTVAWSEEWNKLPLELKKSPSVETFKTKLKTCLSKQSFI